MATLIYGQDPNLRNNGAISTACTDNILYNLLGGNSICVGETILVVDNTQDYALVLPPDTTAERATFAFIQVEVPTVPTDPDRVIRFTEVAGGSPQLGEGIYQGQFGAFEVGGGVNLTNVRFFGITAALVNLRIKYYK